MRMSTGKELDKERMRMYNLLMFWGSYKIEQLEEMPDAMLQFHTEEMTRLIHDRFDGGIGSN